MQVLIAEGDAVGRENLRKTVEEFGHHAITAGDGLEAWNLYMNAPRIDVVISEWRTRGIDGLELCRRIRGANHAGYTPFIFLSDPDGEEQVATVVGAGADDYLTKPLDSEQLQARLLAASRLVSPELPLNGNGKVEGNLANGSGGVSDAGSATNGAASEALTNGALSKRNGFASGQLTGVGSVRFWNDLVSEGKISQEQIQRGLEVHKSDPRDFGKVMVSLGFITASELARAQARHLRLDYVELSERDVDRDVVSLVPERLLRKHRVLPLRIDHVGRLVVAINDPSDIQAVEDLRMASGHKIVPVVATEGDIRRTQAKIFAAGEQVARILKDAAQTDIKDTSELDLGIEAKPNEKPIIRLVSSILQQAIGDGASDIHIEPRTRELVVRIRVDGVLRKIMSVPPKLQSGIIARLKLLGGLDISERRRPQDGRFSVKMSGQRVDLRLASLPAAYGEKVVLRLLDTTSVEADLARLGFGQQDLKRYEEIFRRPHGTILVTGPTGSGKSTTLYATLNEIISDENNIVTVEDPVEYRMPDITQMQVNPKAGLTFASALRSILRADPDVVMIGEIRDYETAKIAVEAALTGHLVLATLHTNDAPGAVSRLTDMGVEPFLTASAVDCVIAQRLSRRLCEYCKKPVEPKLKIMENIGFPFELAPEGDFHFHRATGCSRCGGTGYKGRIGIYELLTVTEELEEMIVRRASNAEIGRAAEEAGMVRLRQDGLLKAARGLTTVEEVMRTVL
jgi:type IV pilus assembly protein PilB